MPSLPSEVHPDVWSQLEEACAHHDTGAFRILWSSGQISGADAYGWRALHYAAFHNRSDFVSFLLGQGVEADALTQKQLSPLHMAAKGRAQEAMDVLLAAGVALDGVDHVGMTALHHVAWVGHAGCAKRLLVAGAARNPVDMRNMTPLHLAARGDHGEVVWLLLEQGADPALTGPCGLDAWGVAHHSGAPSSLRHLQPWHECALLEKASAAAPAPSRSPERL